MAITFHDFVPSCVRHGTRIDGASSSSSRRASTSSGLHHHLVEFQPAKRASSQPRSDHDE